MNRSVRLAVAVAMTLLGLALPAAALAYGGEDSNNHPVRPGAECSAEGRQVTVDTRHNGRQTYRCEQRPGEDCPHWHWVYDPDVPRGTRTHWPVAPCETCPSSPAPSSPAPSGSPSTSPSTPASSSPSATPPVIPAGGPGPQLPVTGPAIWVVVVVGLALVAAGARLMWTTRRRPVDEPRHAR